MINVAFLWHMHQPHYGDPVSGAQMLPWVRLHAFKDYLGMVEMLREFPGIRMTFNLVPSLVQQLEALASGEAEDRYLDLARKPAGQLSPEERSFIVAHFFHAQRQRMIERWPRYRELLELRYRAGHDENSEAGRMAVAAFSEQDLRDLQVWHRLAWVDPMYLDDPRVSELIGKGRGYSEDDKKTLDTVELEIIRRILPAYRAAAASGRIELSTSPYYHPILPLICDTDLYARFRPEARVTPPFRRPEDALLQLARAVESHREEFGAPPRGLWPPEGSVSEEIVPLAARMGFSWMATDEVILARTLGIGFPRDGAGLPENPEALYRPYRVRVAGAEIACVFRDHVLSDLIGFTYSSWDPAAAAEDLVRRIVEGGRRSLARSGGEEPVIGIVLDGENAWEHYADQGRPFLKALYRLLESHPEIRTITMSEAAGRATATLEQLFPGSWANGDFYIWIGHEDDRRAWRQLSEVRQALDEAESAGSLPAAAIERAREAILIAEGSDWFWWYGDDHWSEQDLEYDTLFRAHVETAWRALGLEPPQELAFTNITVGAKAVEIVQPSGPIHPAIDGSAELEGWQGAGHPRFRQLFGAMRQAAPDAAGKVSAIRFGFGGTRFYLRVDMTVPVGEALAKGAAIGVIFQRPAGLRLKVTSDGAGLDAAWFARDAEGSWSRRPDLEVDAAAGEVLELGIPVDVLRANGSEVSFHVTLERGGLEVGRYPGPVPVTTRLPGD